MKYLTLFIVLITFNFFSFSQTNNPSDYLSKSFHKERRDALRKKMPPNSVAVLFANPIRNRSNDVDYIYHQDPNFYYLTGYQEPHAVFVIFSELQMDFINQIDCQEILYVQEKNKTAEMWTGERLGVNGTRQKLGFKCVKKAKDFINNPIDFSKFDHVLFHAFKDNYRNKKNNPADLSDLISNFRTNIDNNKDQADALKKEIYNIIKVTSIENSANVAQQIGLALKQNPNLRNDKIITKYVSADNNAIRREIKDHVISIEVTPEKKKYDTSKLADYMAELREIKTDEEMVLLKKAVRISAQGQIEVMKAITPQMSETEIQGIHEYVYKKYGSEHEGYPSIVGSGNNGCVLHYIKNNKLKVKNDLVLMDLGAQYRGYTADVTRTIPANGKFNTEQRLIYDLVYQAQEAGIAACTVGNEFRESHLATRTVINQGLVVLGIIKEGENHNYFPHGTSHYIGLDVHDTGTYGPLKENSVITVEPGIYIPEGSPCDQKWWGIAVRIEDDILISSKGPINLSREAPRKAEDIEKLMKIKSPLNDFKLPKID